ncbi:hypothetical protein BT63DRAFT_424672, partial [Microthyrium microscopicum]
MTPKKMKEQKLSRIEQSMRFRCMSSPSRHESKITVGMKIDTGALLLSMTSIIFPNCFYLIINHEIYHLFLKESSSSMYLA